MSDKKLSRDDCHDLQALADRLFELYDAWVAGTQYTPQRKRAAHVAETIASYLSCAAEDGGFNEETVTGLLNNLRRNFNDS